MCGMYLVWLRLVTGCQSHDFPHFTILLVLEKVIVTQPVKKFPTFFGMQRFITMFTRSCHWSLSWARCIQCTTSVSLRSILISSHLCLGLPCDFFPSGFLTKILSYLISHIHTICPSQLILLDLMTLFVKFLIMHSSPTFCHLLPLRSKNSPEHLVLKHPNLCFSLGVRDQVSDTYKITGKIMVLYIFVTRMFNPKIIFHAYTPTADVCCSNYISFCIA